jgi:hypothetical protein
MRRCLWPEKMIARIAVAASRGRGPQPRHMLRRAQGETAAEKRKGQRLAAGGRQAPARGGENTLPGAPPGGVFPGETFTQQVGMWEGLFLD